MVESSKSRSLSLPPGNLKLHALTEQMSLPSYEVPLELDWVSDAQCSVWIKRDDLIHPIVSGNKWRKLQPQLEFAVNKGIRHLISIGGGYSNHLHALGYCCHELGLKFTAMVRGNYAESPTPMLSDLANWEADIRFLSKTEYQSRESPSFQEELKTRFPEGYFIPEGGSHTLALQGIANALKEFSREYDFIVAPVASGATLAGIVSACHSNSQALGIAVLKGQGYLESLVNNLLARTQNCAAGWSIHHGFHCRGYAKSTPDLLAFCQQFSDQTDIPIEPVYSGKTLFALNKLLSSGYFPAGSRILCWHTGGMQGARKSVTF